MARPARPPWKNKIAELEKIANQWLKSYPNAGWRENVEVLLVAIAVAMGVRTFFLQPFKIPTARCSPRFTGWNMKATTRVLDF